MKKINKLILGGGISGLAFAHFYKKDDYLILEKEDRAGGLCRSFKYDNSIFDFSGHFLHFKSNEMKDYIFSLVEKNKTGDFKEYIRSSAIWMTDEQEPYIVNYPFQANIHQLKDRQKFLVALSDLYDVHAAKILDALKGEKDHKYKTFGEMVEGTFGKAIADQFFRPYNEKMYCCRLEDLDADAMKRFIPKVSFGEVIDNFTNNKTIGYNNTFLYSAKTGIQGLIDAFKPDEMNINYNEKVIQINQDIKTVVTTSETYQYETLISTLPLQTFQNLSGFIHSDLKHVVVDVFNITFDRVCSTKDYSWLYVPDPKYCFYRIGFYDYMNDDKNAPTSLYVEVSRKEGEKPVTLQKVIDDLMDSRLISEDTKITDFQFLTMNPAYVILENKTDKEVGELKEKLKQKNIELLGRYGKWTYQSIEDNITDAKALAESY